METHNLLLLSVYTGKIYYEREKKSDLQVELICDCVTSVGFMLFPKDCEWKFKDGITCPRVPKDENVILK